MSRRHCENGNGYDRNERSMEEVYQAVNWGRSLAVDRAIGKYPLPVEPALRPTKALSDEVYARYRTADQQAAVTAGQNDAVEIFRV